MSSSYTVFVYVSRLFNVYSLIDLIIKAYLSDLPLVTKNVGIASKGALSLMRQQ